MEKIEAEIYELDASPRSHVYLVQGYKNVLIDTGFPGAGEALYRELQAENVTTLDAIVLTHHDVDHAGNAAFLQERFHIPVYVTAPDLPYLEGQKHRPGVKRAIEKVVRAKPPAHIASLEPGTFEHPALWQNTLEVYAAPGHTPGHCIYGFSDVLFVGDLLHAKDGKLTLPAPFMNVNSKQNAQSLKAALTLPYTWWCPAHGIPVRNTPENKHQLIKVCDELLKER